MYTEPTTFRPRNGLSAEAYWRIRAWCEKNGFSFSDVLNSVILPLAYALENFCEVDRDKNKATVILNTGELEILHVFQGKCYPLASSVTNVSKDGLSLEDMRNRVKHWMERNAKNPQHYDLILLNREKHGKKSTK